MKKYIFLIVFIFTFACTANKGVYWCGDHPCINKDEKESYFKKNMIVEVRNYNKGNIQKDTEIEKLLKQAKLNEKDRKLDEKELIKKAKINERELVKRIKLEEKKRIMEEKELAKILKLDEKKRIMEEKELAKQLKLDEKKRKKTEKVVKLDKKEIKKKKALSVVSPAGTVEISSQKFEELVKKIMKRNSSRSYPEINDIPK